MRQQSRTVLNQQSTIGRGSVASSVASWETLLDGQSLRQLVTLLLSQLWSTSFHPLRLREGVAAKLARRAIGTGLTNLRQLGIMPGEALRSARNLSPKLSSPDTLLAIEFDPPASFVANRSCRKYFLHWRPIGLDPTTVMAAVAAGWDANLRKLELRASTDFGDVEDCDGIVVSPAACRAPGLYDLLTWLEHKIDAG